MRELILSVAKGRKASWKCAEMREHVLGVAKSREMSRKYAEVREHYCAFDVKIWIRGKRRANN